VNEWLVTHVSLVSGDIAFTAEPATTREAEVMGVAPGARRFWWPSARPTGSKGR
jgi:hypothetical protein